MYLAKVESSVAAGCTILGGAGRALPGRLREGLHTGNMCLRVTVEYTHITGGWVGGVASVVA